MPHSIHLARAEDATVLARPRWQFKAEADGLTDRQGPFEQRLRTWYTEALTSGRWFPWLAEQDGQILAHAHVYTAPQVPAPFVATAARGYITAVYTDQEARTTGVGTGLLRHVLTWAELERRELLLLWPSERSVPRYLVCRARVRYVPTTGGYGRRL